MQGIRVTGPGAGPWPCQPWACSRRTDVGAVRAAAGRLDRTSHMQHRTWLMAPATNAAEGSAAKLFTPWAGLAKTENYYIFTHATEG